MEDLSGLARDLEERFTRGVDVPLPDFDDLARRVFRLQFASIPAYREFCRGRGATPDGVRSWEEVPPVPVAAFKHLDLRVGGTGPPEAVFRTSGTTRGAAERGRHVVPSLALYRASLLPNARAHLFPDDAALPVLALLASPSEAPDSSLSYMVDVVAGELGAEAAWFVGREGDVDVAGFRRGAGEVEAEGRPVLVAGTAFAFVHLLDALARQGARLRLPEGSRVMETGGFKGRARSVRRGELYRGVEERLGVPAHRVVNEYGMTELLSQLYEPVLREGPGSERRHVPPPWLGVRALDPATLAPLPPGETGLLAFFDLANAGSVSAILTEDLGAVAADGLRLAGRALGAEPRGCSLALEELRAADRNAAP